MLGNKKWLVVIMTVVLSTIGIAAVAGADSGSEQGFLSAINSTRKANGLGPLSMDGSLQAHARKHTQDMIAAGEIYHSTSAELKAAGGSGWSRLGENVGRGGTVETLHKAFLDSSGHRKNILGDYNFVGIGTDSKDGVLYVTVVFMQKGSTTQETTTTTVAETTTTQPSEQAPAQKSEPVESAKPAETTTTTIAPTTTTTIPPTTTTLIVGPDKPVTPGLSCYFATRDGWICQN